MDMINNKMIRRIKIGGFRATWVIRHRWEKGADSMIENYEANQIKKSLKLGIWFKKYEVVGTIKKGKDRGQTIENTFSKNNLVNNYMVGLDLIVAKVWVDFTFRPTFGKK